MNRRDFVLGLGFLALPAAVHAQSRQVRIGVLSPFRSLTLPTIIKRLGELGFVEGKNLTVDLRLADTVAGLAPLARELAQGKYDLLIAFGAEPAARALVQSTSVVPIMFVAIDYDPVQAGIVSSLGRPGKNVTGIFIPTPELGAKRMELMREMLPGAARILVLSDPYTKDQLKALREVAERMRANVVEVGFAAPPYDLESAFEKGRKAGVEVLFLPTSPEFWAQRARIADLAIAKRLPSIVTSTGWTRSGFLASYGVDATKAFDRAGDIAASILKGRPPGEIPVEQANVYETAINLKVAKALGLTIPAGVRLRADVAIE